jgi:hypothetical protein
MSVKIEQAWAFSSDIKLNLKIYRIKVLYKPFKT